MERLHNQYQLSAAVRREIFEGLLELDPVPQLAGCSAEEAVDVINGMIATLPVEEITTRTCGSALQLNTAQFHSEIAGQDSQHDKHPRSQALCGAHAQENRCEGVTKEARFDELTEEARSGGARE